MKSHVTSNVGILVASSDNDSSNSSVYNAVFLVTLNLLA